MLTARDLSGSRSGVGPGRQDTHARASGRLVSRRLHHEPCRRARAGAASADRGAVETEREHRLGEREPAGLEAPAAGEVSQRGPDELASGALKGDERDGGRLRVAFRSTSYTDALPKFQPPSEHWRREQPDCLVPRRSSPGVRAFTARAHGRRLRQRARSRPSPSRRGVSGRRVGGADLVPRIARRGHAVARLGSSTRAASAPWSARDAPVELFEASVRALALREPATRAPIAERQGAETVGSTSETPVMVTGNPPSVAALRVELTEQERVESVGAHSSRNGASRHGYPSSRPPDSALRPRSSPD